MKIASKVLFFIFLLILISCKEKESIKEVNIDLSTNVFIQKNNKPEIISDENESTDDDYLFEIKSYGVYVINELFDFDMVIDKQNLSLVSCYENLMVFRNCNWYNFVLYNYITKELIDTSLQSIKQITYISDNKLEITGTNHEPEDVTIIMDYDHNNIDNSINYEYDNEIGSTFYGWMSNSNDNAMYIVDIFDKKVCFDITNMEPKIGLEGDIEVYYNNYHKVYFVCAIAFKGR